MFVGLLIAMLLPGAVAPLTSEQRVALETAFDGRDHREEAFVALVENAAAWTAGWGDEPVRLAIDVESLLADPDSVRGHLFEIHGVIQQRSRLPRPHQGVWEWFVRLEDGRPVILFVAGLGDGGEYRDGQRVSAPARFYKRINAAARDGSQREYAAFVGAMPRLASLGNIAAPSPGTPLAVIAAAVVVLLGAFLLVMMHVRRSVGRAGAGRRRQPLESFAAEADHQPGVDEWPPLPDDPAAAMQELKRRAEAARS
jgi:hypothetical protein